MLGPVLGWTRLDKSVPPPGIRYGGTQDRGRIFKRWLTFRNIYILSTDVVFLISVILRCVAFFNNQV